MRTSKHVRLLGDAGGFPEPSPGHDVVHGSLRHFVKEELLKGDNQYNTRDERYGKQDAKRSVRFKCLPKVLQVHLKRFEYDQYTGEQQ